MVESRAYLQNLATSPIAQSILEGLQDTTNFHKLKGGTWAVQASCVVDTVEAILNPGTKKRAPQLTNLNLQLQREGGVLNAFSAEQVSTEVPNPPLTSAPAPMWENMLSHIKGFYMPNKPKEPEITLTGAAAHGGELTQYRKKSMG